MLDLHYRPGRSRFLRRVIPPVHDIRRWVEPTARSLDADLSLLRYGLLELG